MPFSPASLPPGPQCPALQHSAGVTSVPAAPLEVSLHSLLWGVGGSALCVSTHWCGVGVHSVCVFTHWCGVGVRSVCVSTHWCGVGPLCVTPSVLVVWGVEGTAPRALLCACVHKCSMYIC